jgi:site-specific DNA recombinase
LDGFGLRLGRSGWAIPKTINLVFRGGKSRAIIFWGTPSHCQRRTDSMNHHRPVRAAIYARVSSQGQSETGAIACQVNALRARVRQDELHLENTLCFFDLGVTGTSSTPSGLGSVAEGKLAMHGQGVLPGQPRPALDRLREHAAAGSVDRLYVHSPDRLARTYASYVLLIDEFQRCGVEVVFLDQSLRVRPAEKLL